MAKEEKHEENEKHVHGPDCDHDHDDHDHDHEPAHADNPLANLSPEMQAKIQELQMLEQNFQQLLMQKNTFSMEINETDLIIKEVEKSEGEVSRIIGNQVVIKSTKESILEGMKRKKELLETRSKAIDEQEKEFSEKMNSLREEVMKAIQG